MEQTASHSTNTVFSKEDEQRYQQLATRYIDGKTDAAQETEFQQLRQKKMAARAERELCIAQLIKDIEEKNISFAELTEAGLKPPTITELYSSSVILTAAKALGFNPSAKDVEASQPKMSSKKRVVKGYIRSIKNPDEAGIWRAAPPRFFKAEGGLDAYAKGQSIDQWLVDPKDGQSKIKLLQILEKELGAKPNKEQLGDITADAYAKG